LLDDVQPVIVGIYGKQSAGARIEGQRVGRTGQVETRHFAQRLGVQGDDPPGTAAHIHASPAGIPRNTQGVWRIGLALGQRLPLGIQQHDLPVQVDDVRARFAPGSCAGAHGHRPLTDGRCGHDLPANQVNHGNGVAAEIGHIGPAGGRRHTPRQAADPEPGQLGTGGGVVQRHFALIPVGDDHDVAPERHAVDPACPAVHGPALRTAVGI
jgi:hypothetical protein